MTYKWNHTILFHLKYISTEDMQIIQTSDSALNDFYQISIRDQKLLAAMSTRFT